MIVLNSKTLCDAKIRKISLTQKKKYKKITLSLQKEEQHIYFYNVKIQKYERKMNYISN